MNGGFFVFTIHLKGVYVRMEKVSFIGAGSMAEAIIAGLVNKRVIATQQIYVTNKENEERLEQLEQAYNITGTTDKIKVVQDADVIVIATKPYDVVDALNDVKTYIKEDQLVISVVAGISTELIENTLEKKAPVIRTMPNTSAAIGYSATAITKGKFATDTHLSITEKLFEAIGTVSIVKEEKMHIVTALSGSGPAYVYYLVEAMEAVARAEGLDETIAKDLITQTIIGAGNMLKETNEQASTLRENVTSPNGTTAAGLATLRKYQFKEAIENCIKNAKQRSIELDE